MNLAEFDWQFRTGKDTDGDTFSDWLYVHGSGRIFAAVIGPASKDGYIHRVAWCIPVPDAMRDSTIDFVNFDDAKRYVEEFLNGAQWLTNVLPVAPPEQEKKDAVFNGAIY
jgi:hypothetical protein